MKKILVVLTGGTIGSRVEGNSIDVAGNSMYRLISLYQQQYGKEEEFEVLTPLSVLSENMQPKYWTELIGALWDIPFAAYQGVIITHGSDTLSYTSALLGMVFAHVPVPMVITASNYPLGEPGSNGLYNFRNSISLLKTPHLRGVFTVYQDQNMQNNVYLATRMIEADCYEDQFRAFGGTVFGRIEEGELELVEDERNPSLNEVCAKRSPITGSCPVFEKQVLMIRPYPGMDYKTVDLSGKPVAVLHCLYHSSTACTEGKDCSLLGFLERCREENIPVYTASYKDREGRSYVTAREILKKGAIPMFNISPEAAYMKLMLLYNSQIYKKAEDTIYFENLPIPKKRS